MNNPDPKKSPVFDPESRIANVGGKRVYLKVLGMFLSNQSQATKMVQDALAANDSKTAERTAHTLKGVALTIGAATLSETARQLEAAIKENLTEQYPALIANTSMALTEVLALVEAYLKEHSLPVEPNKSANFDPAAFAGLLQHLTQQLSVFDCGAENTVQQIIQQAKDPSMTAHFAAIQQHIKHYDYEAALKATQQFANNTVTKPS